MPDSTECDHTSPDLSGSIDYEGDTVYVSGTCVDCGASLSAVYQRTHYLVWEHEDGDPVEVDA